MKCNVGYADMATRVILGIVLLYLGFADNPILSDGLPKTIIGYFALVPLLTGLLRFCPLYALIGVSTANTATADSEED